MTMEKGRAHNELRSRAAVLRTVSTSRPYTDSAPLKIEEVEVLPPRQEEVLIRVSGAGICHSDLFAVEGIRKFVLPLVVGHECAGVVEEVGQGVKRVKEGDHVVISFVAGCGSCFQCIRGTPNQCEMGRGSNRMGTLVGGGTRFRLNGS